MKVFAIGFTRTSAEEFFRLIRNSRVRDPMMSSHQ